MRPRSFLVDTTNSPQARLRPQPISAVRLEDSFWAPRLDRNRRITIPSQYLQLEETGRLDNFRRAAGKISGPFRGFFYNDSDVFKWLEAAAWTLASDEDHDIRHLAESVIELMLAAQSPDGYLDTYFTYEKASERWSNLRDKHELYCAGHFLQAAIAWERCAVEPGETGGVRMLSAAQRMADNITTIFGPGGRSGVPGHPEIEMALVELFRETGERSYLVQAEKFIRDRGRGYIGGSSYHLDHLPLTEMDHLVGHAVRALYLSAGAADLVLETGADDVEAALVRLWRNLIQRQMYASGGVGSRTYEESLGEDYELPNATAYAESCAAIANIYWNWRMLQRRGDAPYADILELALYNGALAGLSMDGQEYFYVNPLESNGSHRRQAWFDCACCPPNLARLLASLPGYFYSTSLEKDGPEIWVHQYAQSRSSFSLPEGRKITLVQQTNYPWEGDIELEIQTEASEAGNFTLYLRIPDWCESAQLAINGKTVNFPVSRGTYTRINRNWRAGDGIRLILPMPARKLRSHPYVVENVGRVALMRGPILYCVESVDQPASLDLRDFHLDMNEAITTLYNPQSLDGIVELHLAGRYDPPPPEWENKLYQPAMDDLVRAAGTPTRAVAIPYYAWANRLPGQMQVWLKAG